MFKKYIDLINKENIEPFLKALIPALVLIIFVALQPWHEPKIFLRDSNTGIYYGLVSNIGAFLWNGTFIISLFGAYYAKEKAVRNFLFCAAYFTLFLLIDDFFMIHDNLFTLRIGWPEEVLYIAYFGGLGLYLYLYKKLNDLYYAPLLFSALAFLGMGLIGDMIGIGHLIEDGTKFIGIALWLSFHWVFVWNLIRGK